VPIVFGELGDRWAVIGKEGLMVEGLTFMQGKGYVYI